MAGKILRDCVCLGGAFRLPVGKSELMNQQRGSIELVSTKPTRAFLPTSLTISKDDISIIFWKW